MKKEIRDARLDKLRNLTSEGIDPYPAKSNRTHMIIQAVDDFDGISSSEKKISIAGRIKTIRAHGGLLFMNLEDKSGTFQLFFKRDEIGKENYDFINNLDIGDFLEAEGTLFLTKKGEKTLNVKGYKILTKSLLPLPEKWHGLQNEEIRYRKRYLDLIMNKDVKRLFEKRSEFVNHIREFLNSNDYIEVETPVLENIPGGADAEPFITHHNKLDIDLYLRISLELHLKRLMVGGFEKIYEIGRVFRNEGISPQHLQEFTMLEFYWAYADYEDLMKFVETFYTEIIKKTFGTLEIKYQGKILDFNTPWPKFDYREIIIKESGIDIDKYPTKEDMQNISKERGIKIDLKAGRGRLIDQLYKKLVRPKLYQPCFLINHPLDISPLAKKKDDDRNKVQRFQVLIAGAEIGNGFSELNDPIDQRDRFEAQAKLREEGDAEAQMMDEDFIEALSYGMPPTAGFGVGIDRFLTVLMDQDNIRDVVFFPMMKPIENEKIKAKNEKVEDTNMELGIDPSKASMIFDKYVTDKNTKLHSIESKAIMEGIAEFLKGDKEKWGIIGLLHDIDWDQTKNNTTDHCIKSSEILKVEGASDFLINTIESHGYGCVKNSKFDGKSRSTAIEHLLAASETLTGLIVASAIIQPDKKLSSVKLSSLKKKFKSKSFAANCNREIINECELGGIRLDEFLEIGLKAMQGISNDLGL